MSLIGTTLYLSPAYGRRYNSSKEMKDAFLSGVDFSTCFNSGPYTSVHEVLKYLPNTKTVVLTQGLYRATVVRSELENATDTRTCECGADIGYGQVVCRSCNQAYKEGRN